MRRAPTIMGGLGLALVAGLGALVAAAAPSPPPPPPAPPAPPTAPAEKRPPTGHGAVGALAWYVGELGISL